MEARSLAEPVLEKTAEMLALTALAGQDLRNFAKQAERGWGEWASDIWNTATKPSSKSNMPITWQGIQNRWKSMPLSAQGATIGAGGGLLLGGLSSLARKKEDRQPFNSAITGGLAGGLLGGGLGLAAENRPDLFGISQQSLKKPPKIPLGPQPKLNYSLPNPFKDLSMKELRDLDINSVPPEKIPLLKETIDNWVTYGKPVKSVKPPNILPSAAYGAGYTGLMGLREARRAGYRPSDVNYSAAPDDPSVLQSLLNEIEEPTRIAPEDAKRRAAELIAKNPPAGRMGWWRNRLFGHADIPNQNPPGQPLPSGNDKIIRYALQSGRNMRLKQPRQFGRMGAGLAASTVLPFILQSIVGNRTAARRQAANKQFFNPTP